MEKQTAIRISRQETDSTTFAQVLHMTLERLQEEEWDSRIFQFGREGVMIIASRIHSEQPALNEPESDIPEEMLPVADEQEWFTDIDSLDKTARGALDRIFEVIGPVPEEVLLDAIELATPVALGHYPPHTLHRLAEQFETHRVQHVSELDETDDHGYAAILETVVEAITELFVHRVN